MENEANLLFPIAQFGILMKEEYGVAVASAGP